MTDYTELPVQSGGDKIAVNAVTEQDTYGNPVVDTQIVQLAVAELGQPPVLVTPTAPLPTTDLAVWLLLKEILQVLREILHALQKPR